jgi:hypothetical protein
MTPERTAASARGTIAGYSWAEDWTADLVAADIVAALPDRLVALRALCTSWDSGMLDPVASGMPAWNMHSGNAVSPVLSADHLKAWPQSSCGWDEWYFFRTLPTGEKLQAFCNWGGLSLAAAGAVTELPSGFDLAGQLRRCSPELVIGDGQRIFIIARDPQAVLEFEHLCGRRRTTR